MNIKDLLEIIGESYVESIKEQLVFFGLQDSNIINSISYSIVNTTVVINIPEYAIFIENGRRPGSTPPPIAIILRWIQRKRIKGRNRVNGRFISNNSLAFMIARAIGRRGIRPKPFLQRATEAVGEEVASTFAIQFSDIIDDNIKRILQI